MKPIVKAAWLGAVPSAIVFFRIFFAVEMQDFALAQRGISITHCFGEAPVSLAFRASLWAFGVYAVVFTPALLYFNARIYPLTSMKTRCTKCGAEILTTTADYSSGLCGPCYALARAIAWRRSAGFIWIGLVLPALLIALALWQMFHQRWVWTWALIVLVPLVIRNFRERTSTEPPPC